MKNLKLLRKSFNLTLQQLAEELGTSNQVLSRYERGEREADYETLAKIARFFNVSIDYLLGFKSATTPEPLPLPLDETELLQNFRKLPADLQHRATVYMKKLVELSTEEAKTTFPPAITQAKKVVAKK